MKKMTDYLTSNLLKAADIEPNVRIEAIIVSIRDRDFEDGTTKPVIYTDYLGKGVVLNQTRLKAGVAAFGPHPDNWVGKSIVLSRGPTTYKGEPTWAVVMEPVVANRIAASGAPTAIGNRWGPPEPPAPIERYEDPEDGDDGTENIPF
jgi:hypothetical protein